MTVNLKNFFNPKVKMSKMGEFQELKPIDGLQISALSADLYGDGRDDLALFYFQEGANFAAVYADNLGTALLPARDDMLIIVPELFRFITGITCFIILNVGSKLSFTMELNISELISSIKAKL